MHNFQLHGRDQSQAIFASMAHNTAPLAQFVEFRYGFKTADDQKFIQSIKRHKESKLFIRSAGVHRYLHDEPAEYVWYVPDQMVENRKTARPGDHCASTQRS